MKFYPFEKGGGPEKVLAMLKGGFQSFKGGARKVLPCLDGGGGGQKGSDPRFSHFVAPPPRN